MNNLEKIKNKIRSGRILGIDYSHPDYQYSVVKPLASATGDIRRNLIIL